MSRRLRTHCTISVAVAECSSDPEVPVMVNVYVSGSGGEVPSPQALKRAAESSTSPSSRHQLNFRFFDFPPRRAPPAMVRPGTPRNSNAYQSVPIGVPPCRSALCVKEAAKEPMDTVNVELAAFAFGVTVFGEKVHEVCAGKPEQASATSLPKAPLSGVTVTV